MIIPVHIRGHQFVSWERIIASFEERFLDKCVRILSNFFVIPISRFKIPFWRRSGGLLTVPPSTWDPPRTRTDINQTGEGICRGQQVGNLSLSRFLVLQCLLHFVGNILPGPSSFYVTLWVVFGHLFLLTGEINGLKQGLNPLN